MKTYYRKCIKEFEIEDSRGTKFKVEAGKQYLTSEDEGNKVTVFSKYWVQVPVSIFEGKEIFT